VIQNSQSEVIKIDIPQDILLQEIKKLRIKKAIKEDEAVFHAPFLIKDMKKESLLHVNNVTLGFNYDNRKLKKIKKE
jgi:hypothetical protein